MKLLAIVLFTLCASFSGQEDLTRHRIVGTVLDAQGAPVSGASVDVIDSRGSLLHPVPMALTNKEGHFQTAELPGGTYKLYPWKVSAGVPDPIYDLLEAPDVIYLAVTLDSKYEEDKEVSLAFPKPFATLSGNVVDRSSKQPIQHARLVLRRTDNPSIYLAKSCGPQGHFEMLLPSRPLTITITAPGYEDYQDRKGGVLQNLKLSAGQITNQTFALQPLR